MATGINQTRRSNVKALIASRYEGNTAAFAKAIGKPESQIYRYFNEGENGRNISTRTARLIEEKMAIAEGVLDIAHNVESLRKITVDPMVEEIALMCAELGKVEQAQVMGYVGYLISEKKKRQLQRSDNKHQA